MGAKSHAVLAALLLCAGSSALASDTSPICPDRPGKSTGTCTAAARHFQVETGLVDWSLQKDGGERETSLVVGDTVIKLGLTDRSDIELNVTPFVRIASRQGDRHDGRSGIGDLTLLYKHRLTPNDTPLQVAALPFVKIPTARRPLGNGRVEAGLLVPISFAIADSPFSIGATPEIDWLADGDGHGRHAAMAQVVSLGWSVTDKLGLSAELWGQWDWDPAETTRQYSADASIAYLVNDDLQLDAGGNFGLNRTTPDLELYAGVSKRF